MNLRLLITARSAPDELLSDGGACLLEAPLPSKGEKKRLSVKLVVVVVVFLCVVLADGHVQRVTVWKDVWVTGVVWDVVSRKNEGGRMVKNWRNEKETSVWSQ